MNGVLFYPLFVLLLDFILCTLLGTSTFGGQMSRLGSRYKCRYFLRYFLPSLLPSFLPSHSHSHSNRNSNRSRNRHSNRSRNRNSNRNNLPTRVSWVAGYGTGRASSAWKHLSAGQPLRCFPSVIDS
ncbi:hypothetical protein BZA05DRAFT_404873 [Tricharina praecox]|uniref:uncharacterized protein n=1 Tax=Tricharina praecox TaxID=43433 RepID=UPI00221EB2D8|nr:uncharacterized protein BZA05DRAFT_404873 [Tricharina praecox]KAI5847456.1 hypothetical protein BZA05DRAFT_404873 [Tricharina praecox]